MIQILNKIWWFLTQAVESVKICTLKRYLCRKYVIIEQKNQRSCVVKNGLWFDKWHKEFGEELFEVKLDKSSAYNVLVEEMYFFGQK